MELSVFKWVSSVPVRIFPWFSVFSFSVSTVVSSSVPIVFFSRVLGFSFSVFMGYFVAVVISIRLPFPNHNFPDRAPWVSAGSPTYGFLLLIRVPPHSWTIRGHLASQQDLLTRGCVVSTHNPACVQRLCLIGSVYLHVTYSLPCAGLWTCLCTSVYTVLHPYLYTYPYVSTRTSLHIRM